MSETVSHAIEERLEGGQPGRWKAFIAAVVIGFVAFLATYKLLRSSDDDS